MKMSGVPDSEGNARASGSSRMVRDNGGQIRVTDRDEAGAKTHPAGDEDERILAQMRGLVRRYDCPFEPAWQQDD